MNVVIVTINQDNAAIAGWLAEQDFSGCTLTHWQIEPQPVVAEQVLDALVEQWQRTPAEFVLFPPGASGDELATRLAGVYMAPASARSFRWIYRQQACANPTGEMR